MLDPLTLLGGQEPFAMSVAPGEYGVYLSIAQINIDQRVAFAMIQFSNEVARRWKMALASGQDECELNEGEIYGYGVDSGTGCFMDKTAVEILRREYDRDARYYERIVKEMERTYVDTWSYANMALSDECNLVAFTSGLGDGVYASYFGFGSTTDPVCLVTDFGIADPSDEGETELAQEKRPGKWWQIWRK